MQVSSAYYTCHLHACFVSFVCAFRLNERREEKNTPCTCRVGGVSRASAFGVHICECAVIFMYLCSNCFYYHFALALFFSIFFFISSYARLLADAFDILVVCALIWWEVIKVRQRWGIRSVGEWWLNTKRKRKLNSWYVFFANKRSSRAEFQHKYVCIIKFAIVFFYFASSSLLLPLLIFFLFFSSSLALSFLVFALFHSFVRPVFCYVVAALARLLVIVADGFHYIHTAAVSVFRAGCRFVCTSFSFTLCLFVFRVIFLLAFFFVDSPVNYWW